MQQPLVEGPDEYVEARVEELVKHRHAHRSRDRTWNKIQYNSDNFILVWTTAVGGLIVCECLSESCVRGHVAILIGA